MAKEHEFERARIKFVHEKGYGFVTREDGKPDAFFHVANLEPGLADALEPNLEVEVAVGEHKKGPVVLVMRP